MKNADIETRFVDLVSQQMGVSKEHITKDTTFVDDLGADSLDLIEMVMEVEEEFDISIPDQDADNLRTVGDTIHYIRDHVE